VVIGRNHIFYSLTRGFGGTLNFAITEESSGGDGGFVETFKNPPEVSSSGGVLNLTLTAEPKEVDIAGQ
jgi:hypothetical protein